MIAAIRSKYFERWLPGYVTHLARRLSAPRSTGTRHLLFALCDHYEPLWGDASHVVGVERVRAWTDAYPRLARAFTDADGRHPRHSFFFPGEQYRPGFLDALGTLARAGLGEVEYHLHHRDDTAESLRAQIDAHLSLFAQHGHLSRAADGRLRYGFIHGNWALANGRRDGRFCGVDNELQILFDSGCYADFTFPSVPDDSQPNIVNRIYWPTGDLSRARCYEQGEPARVGAVFHDRILLVQGPLALSRRPGRWSGRIENSALTAHDVPSLARARTWVAQHIHVQGRPDWTFVKVHTHGAPEAQAAALLGDGGRALHEALTTHFNDGQRWRLHYVTAREMFNVAMAAMGGASGDPAAHRDAVLAPPPCVVR